MTVDNNVRIPILDGKNYNNWKTALKIILEIRELDDFVYGNKSTNLKQEDPLDKKKHNQAKCILVGSLDDDHLTKVCGAETAAAIWQTITSLNQLVPFTHYGSN